MYEWQCIQLNSMQYYFSQTRGTIINLFGYPILPSSICCLGLILISQSLINWREMLANIGFNFVLTTNAGTQTTTQVHWLRQTSINAKDIEFFVVNKCNAYSDWKLDLGGTTYNILEWVPMDPIRWLTGFIHVWRMLTCNNTHPACSPGLAARCLLNYKLCVDWMTGSGWECSANNYYHLLCSYSPRVSSVQCRLHPYWSATMCHSNDTILIIIAQVTSPSLSLNF